MHACPVHRCTIQVDDRYLLCRLHWRLVPLDLQTAVWRAYQRLMAKPEDQVRAAALRDAQQDAIAAANQRLRAVA